MPRWIASPFWVVMAGVRVAAAQPPPAPPPPDPPAPVQPPAPDPPPSPSDATPSPTPTTPSEAPSPLVRKEFETPVPDAAEPVEGTARARRRELAIELSLGMNQRIGGGTGFDQQEKLDVSYGAGLFWFAFDAAALGIELEHAGLGSGAAQTGVSVLNAEYSATTAWLSGRFVPFDGADFEPFVALRVGLSLQHVEADGVRPTASPFESPATFSCNATDGPAFALGGGVGAALALGGRLRLVGRVDADAQRLSGDAIGSCVAGLGSSTSVSAGLGLAYAFGGPAPGAAQQ